MTTVTRQIHFAVNGNRKQALPGPAPEAENPSGRTLTFPPVLYQSLC